MQIEVENLSITFTQNQSEMTALKDVSLEIEKGEFICLLGPSGCGKSRTTDCSHGEPLKKMLHLALRQKKFQKKNVKKSCENISIWSGLMVPRKNAQASSPVECSNVLPSPAHLLLILRFYLWTSPSVHWMQSRE